jgi:hypothetical protein
MQPAHPESHAPEPAHRCATKPRIVLSGIEVVRDGRVEPFVRAHPSLTSAAVRWSGVALENYSNAPVVIPRHEHLEHFVHLVVRGSVRYQVYTHTARHSNFKGVRAPLSFSPVEPLTNSHGADQPNESLLQYIRAFFAMPWMKQLVVQTSS